MRRSAAWTLALGLFLSCHKSEAPVAAPAALTEAAPGPASEAKVDFEEDPDVQGLELRLYEAKPRDDGSERLPTAAATPLDKGAVTSLLARLPPLEGESADQQAFALREGPVPPPRTGATVQQPFPPPDDGSQAPKVDNGPLTVLRKSPEGAVPMAPNLSVTFSGPMIPVTTQEEASKIVPVKLSPQPAGQWRWLGTRTLMFDPDPRFPMATRYTAEIPAGTASQGGGKLAGALTWTFETPPPKLVGTYPDDRGASRRGSVGDPQPADPLIFLSFDQKIAPEAVAAKLSLEGGGGTVGARLASADEIAANKEIAALVKAAEADRWLVVRPQKPLALDSRYHVVVPVGTPSAEGPLTTTAAQGFYFRTYGPMVATELSCYAQHPCPPTYPWVLRFTNPIVEDTFDPSAFVTVTPAVPGLEMHTSGQMVVLQGAFQPRSTYKVQVAAGVPDVFGQKSASAVSFSIDVGPADRSFSGPDRTFVAVDPNAPPAVSFFTTNQKGLRVTIQRVSPEDWSSWVTWQQRYRWEDARKAPLPGTRLAQKVLPVQVDADRMVETAVDLQPYLQGGAGQFILQVEPSVQSSNRWERQEWLGWVQVTKLGLTVLTDQRQVVTWVSALSDGAPIKGAQISLLGVKGAEAETGADGLGALTLSDKEASAVIARSGSDVAILPADPNGWGYGSWIRVDPTEQTRWFVFDDKNLYKPSETVHVRGWLRTVPAGQHDITALSASAKKISWQAYSSEGNPLGQGEATISGLGGFSFDLELPDTPNLGTARVDLQQPETGSGTSMTFEIQEFRTPEFEVTASGGDGVYALGEDAFVDVHAAYYAGGALPTAPVRWSVSSTEASFAPPGRSDWTFGPWAPWWRWWSDPTPYHPPAVLDSSTDAGGDQHLGVHFEALNPPRPMMVTAEATVTDVNRQAWSSSKSFLVHPAAWYVGLKAKPFVESDAPIDVESLVVDRDGEEVGEARVEISLQKLGWKKKNGQWGEDRQEIAHQSAGASGKQSFPGQKGGQYAIVATVRDAQGRRNQTELRVWVSGGDLEPDRGVAQERVTLIPDHESWEVGQTAKVLVQAPFFPAEGLLSLRAGDLLETRRFHMDGDTTVLELAITEAHVPDLTVAVDLVGQRVRSGDDGRPRPDLAKRPAYAAGSVTLKVPPLSRTLSVALTPATARLDPGGSTSVDVLVKDAAGKPVPDAELALVAVDEAVLALTGYRLPDPLDTFYAARGDGISSYHLREWLNLARPETAMNGLGAAGEGRGGGGLMLQGAIGTATGTAAFGMSGDGEELKKSEESRVRTKAAPMPDEPPAPSAPAARADKMYKEMADDVAGSTAQPGPAIQLRTDFSAVALWVPSLRTDASGHAKVALKLPDNLTRYRIMAVAVAGGRQFGSGDADVTARLPLMVRPSAPRFLNFGDRFELPVVIQNQTDAVMTVDVAVRASNTSFIAAVSDPIPDPSKAGGMVGARVSVPANDRVELRFPTAAAMSGTARFQFAASSGAYADAANVSLPVWTPATTEAFATYGTLDGGATLQPVSAPADVWSQYGGLEVTVSSTQLQALTDAFVYLVRYPYDCNEQIASRILGVAALHDVLRAFGSKDLPSDKELAAIMAADLDHLEQRQNADGGFSFWRRGDASWPYVSLHVVDAIERAKAKGYAVDPAMEARALNYAATIQRHIPSWYSKESKWYLRGYAISVVAQSGRDQVGAAKALLGEAGVDALPAEAKGWILPVLSRGKATSEVSSLLAWMNGHVAETAAGAHLVTSYSDGEYVLLHSDREADAVWLDALLQTSPKNDLVVKLVNGLLAHRTAGRWANDNESSFVLLALDRYFRVYEGVTPDFVARVWLGKGLAGEQRFQGRSTDRDEIDVPMSWLQGKGSQDLVISQEGEGRLYYRIGLSYAPLDLNPPAADYGFTVLRSYEGVDDPKDVRQDEQGVWHVRAGARVRVKLTMVSPMRRYHVALVDPLPAGLEVLNPDLKGTGALPVDAPDQRQPYWWWSRSWYEHENFRDERVEAFASLLWDGVFDYSYVARATTPGDFVVPPTKAEEMYSPETFGRAAGDRMIVE